ncbi:MAG: hypothetical protein KA200_06710, partial [Burkholderiales bacterium]|nr:hypothetical protein [Burkholderiales bacterium]
MTTLRVRLPVPFDPSAPAAWWRVDDQGRIVERGTSSPPAWPAADRIEAVLGAGDVRIVALELPPMNDARRASAAAFALEDQLAAPADTMHLAVTAPASVGASTVVRIADRAAVTWLAARRPAIDRVVAEPDLAPSDGTWRWCAGADGRGFVRRSDGSAFAADAPGGTELPAELAAALAHARRDAGAAGAPPARIVVDAPADAPRLAAWTQATGVAFVQGTPWSLERVPDASWRSAPDVRAGHSILPSAAPASIARRFAPAVALALAALALHVVLTAAGWTRDRYVAWRADRAVVELARGAGIDPVPDARAAEAALAKRATGALHASARMAEGDALPLIARAAGPLATLPPGSVRK